MSELFKDLSDILDSPVDALRSAVAPKPAAAPAPVQAAPPAAEAAPVQAPIAPPPAPQAPMVPQPATPALAQQTTTTFTPGVKLPEAMKQQQNAAVDAKEKAALAANAVEAESAKNTALVLQQKNNELELQQQRDAANALHIQQQADKAQQAYLSAIDDYKANNKVDPDKNKSVGTGILAAIAQGLGAFGSALTHTPNYAQQIIKDAADAEVREQERAIAQGRDLVGLQGNIVQHFRQQGLDAESSARAAKSVILDRAIGKIDALTASSKNEDLLARAGMLKAAAMAEKSDLATKNFAQEQGKFVKQVVTAPAGTPSVNDQINMNELKVDVPQSDPKTGKEIGTRTYIARSKTDAEKIRQAYVVKNAIQGNLERMGTLIDDKWQSIPLSTGKKQVEALADDLRTQFGVLRGLGALSDKDYKIASQLGDPTAWLQTDNQTHELMGQFQAGIDGMVEAEMKGRGMYR